jgi:hypothetical protein
VAGLQIRLSKRSQFLSIKLGCSARTGAEWYTKTIDHQTRIRIRLAIAAYAYEAESRPIMSDADFDALANEVDLSIETRRPDLDEYFRTHFSPHTGQWVWKHPDRARLATLLRQIPRL